MGSLRVESSGCTWESCRGESSGSGEEDPGLRMGEKARSYLHRDGGLSKEKGLQEHCGIWEGPTTAM